MTLERSRWQHFLLRKYEEYGERFSVEGINQDFIRYYESQQQVKVRFEYGEVKTGRIGVTTGWKPCFLLMIRANSLGSSWTIGPKDKIIAIKHKKTYKEI